MRNSGKIRGQVRKRTPDEVFPSGVLLASGSYAFADRLIGNLLIKPRPVYQAGPKNQKCRPRGRFERGVLLAFIFLALGACWTKALILFRIAACCCDSPPLVQQSARSRDDGISVALTSIFCVGWVLDASDKQ